MLGAVIASITVAIVRIPKLGNQVQSLEPNFIREMKEGVVVLRQNKRIVLPYYLEHYILLFICQSMHYFL